VPSKETPTKPAVSVSGPEDKIITVEAELAKT
jgi:hypothetical protein